MDQGHGHSCGHTTSASERETDPVCGMTVDPARSSHRADHAGTTYHFCSARCRERFIAETARFLAVPTAESTPGTPA